MNRRKAMKLVLGATLSAPALATGSGRAGPIVDRKIATAVDRKNAAAISRMHISFVEALANVDRPTEEEKLRAIRYFSKSWRPG